MTNPNSDDIIVPYDGGDIWVERLGCITNTETGGASISTHNASGLKTNVQLSEIKHSPTGFNFGYGGSGSADLALNICRMFCDKNDAHRIYQDFKWKFVSSEKSDKLIIKKSDIISFINENI